MKTLKLQFLIQFLIILSLSTAFAVVDLSSRPFEKPTRNHSLQLPHIDLEMTGEEYRFWLDQMIFGTQDHLIKQSYWQNSRIEFLWPKINAPVITLKSFSHWNTTNELQVIVTLGKRNLDWIKLLNTRRPEPLSFSSPEHQIAYPLDQPNVYNPRLIQERFSQFQKKAHPSFQAVLFSQQKLPDQLPADLSEDDYLRWGRIFDRIYQSSVRWIMMSQNIEALKRRQSLDLRGYYHLSKMPNRYEKLLNYSQLSENEKVTLRQWLIQMCMNSNTQRYDCIRTIDRAIQQKSLNQLFSDWAPHSEKLWLSFFVLQEGQVFKDVRWNALNNVRIPFRRVNDSSIAHFIKSNIEDEFRKGQFQLYVDFNLNSQHSVFVTWKPNVTPHVPYLGASEIVMNSAEPLSEYNVQWTIRHEFGHVLGFPDCYIEFYDESVQAIVSYQIDTTNLMCSRRGSLKETHVHEMKRMFKRH